MTSYRTQIMALPEKDRLDYALDIIDMLSGTSNHTIDYLRDLYGLSVKEAQILDILNDSHGRLVNTETFISKMYPHVDDSPESKIIQVYMCKLRRKIPYKISNVLGSGYRLDGKIEIPEPTHPVSRDTTNDYKICNSFRKWSKAERVDLIKMYKQNRNLRYMADQLHRSERAVQYQISFLKLRENFGDMRK